MKKFVATLIALSVAAAVAAPMAAEARTKKKKRTYYQPYATQAAPRNEVYQEFLADKRPVGTTSWWQQMDREGRGGQSRAN
jgi:hypothetical protein